MLTRSQIERLEIMEQWLEEIVESEEFAELDFYPDITLGDSLQAVQEVLTNYYPAGYTAPKPILHIKTVRPWHEKLKDRLFVTLSDISGVLVMTAALSGCISVCCWGLSDAKNAFGYTSSPDFAAQSQAYRGLAIASLGAALTCGVVGSLIKEMKK